MSRVDNTDFIKLYSSCVHSLLIWMLHKWNCSSALRSACVGSTHKWEVKSPATALRCLSSVSVLPLSPIIQKAFRLFHQWGCRSSAGPIKWHFRCSWQMHLSIPSHQMLATLLEFGQWQTLRDRVIVSGRASVCTSMLHNTTMFTLCVCVSSFAPPCSLSCKQRHLLCMLSMTKSNCSKCSLFFSLWLFFDLPRQHSVSEAEYVPLCVSCRN